MAGILGGHPLAAKDVSQVTAAVSADNFRSTHAQRMIGMPYYGSRDLIVERRPSASAIELVGRAVEWRVAPAANEHPGSLVIPILAGESALRSLLGDDVFFLRCQFIPIRLIDIHL